MAKKKRTTHSPLAYTTKELSAFGFTAQERSCFQSIMDVVFADSIEEVANPFSQSEIDSAIGYLDQDLA